jgi:hypothetical protein
MKRRRLRNLTIAVALLCLAARYVRVVPGIGVFVGDPRRDMVAITDGRRDGFWRLVAYRGGEVQRSWRLAGP